MPEADRAPNAKVVPCLGGLTAPGLLDLIVGTDGAIVIRDHGWCEQCSLARTAQPWIAALEETKQILATVDPLLPDRVSLESDPIPPTQAGPIMAALRPDKNVNRRDFLRHFVSATEPADPVAESWRVAFGRGPVRPVNRQRILASLRALAEGYERDLPAELMPAIKVSDDCELHGVCAAICPTGALRRIAIDSALALEFDAADCIACGECERVCPSKALQLWPQGDGRLRHRALTLIERASVSCTTCGESFAASGDEQSCPTCRKTMNVMREVASLNIGSPVPN